MNWIILGIAVTAVIGLGYWLFWGDEL